MLDGQVVLVTGCSRGIGKSIVNRFLANGAIVYANVRTQENADEILKEGQHRNTGKLHPLVFDVTDREDVRQAFVTILREQGRVDCLVNNAGILIDTLITMLDRKTLQSIYETNVFAVFETMHYASRIMSKQKRGSIINIASICGDEGGMRGQTAYSSSKGAVIALTKTAAKELGQFGIRVNSISPGFIETDMFRSGPKRIQEQLVNGVYLEHRVGLPDEVAEVCAFLASNKASYITGENIRVDGFAHI